MTVEIHLNRRNGEAYTGAPLLGLASPVCSRCRIILLDYSSVYGFPLG